MSCIILERARVVTLSRGRPDAECAHAPVEDDRIAMVSSCADSLDADTLPSDHRLLVRAHRTCDRPHLLPRGYRFAWIMLIVGCWDRHACAASGEVSSSVVPTSHMAPLEEHLDELLSAPSR